MEQQPKKHSACDECRLRKLKCSGCPSGCERCHRDKVECVYSVQKPMGRPRKHRKDAGSVGEDVVGTPRQSTNSRVTQPDNLGTGIFMGEFEWMNNETFDPSNVFGGISSLDDLPQYLGATVETPFQMFPPRRTSTRRASEILLQAEGAQSESTANELSSYFSMDSEQLPTLCSCVSAFFTTISALRIQPPMHSVSLQHVIQTSNSTLMAARYTLTCESCHADFQSTYITSMMLGIQLPLLCQFYYRVLASIDATTDQQEVIMDDGQTVQLDIESWRLMAKAAIKKEALKVLDLVAELETLATRLQNVAGNTESGPEPLCWRILQTIKAGMEYLISL